MKENASYIKERSKKVRFTLVENAIDSFKIAIDSFKEWQYVSSKKEDHYLKITVFFLQNAVELLIKSWMIENDPKSIYCNIDTSKMDDAIREANARKMPLDEYLIAQKGIKTISYSEMLNNYYPNNSREKELFLRLGYYRNTIAHFGIDNELSPLTLYNTVLEVFNWFLDEAYDDLIEKDKCFAYNDIIDILEDWKEGSEYFQNDLALSDTSLKLASFVDILKKVMSSEGLKKFADAYEIFIDDDSSYEKYDIRLLFKKENQEYLIYSKYDVFYNNTILYFYYKGVPTPICIVLHEKNQICIYNQESQNMFNLEDESKRVIIQEVSKDCNMKNLTEKNVQNIIIDFLRKRYKC